MAHTPELHLLGGHLPVSIWGGHLGGHLPVSIWGSSASQQLLQVWSQLLLVFHSDQGEGTPIQIRLTVA